MRPSPVYSLGLNSRFAHFIIDCPPILLSIAPRRQIHLSNKKLRALRLNSSAPRRISESYFLSAFKWKNKQISSLSGMQRQPGSIYFYGTRRSYKGQCLTLSFPFFSMRTGIVLEILKSLPSELMLPN